MKRALISLALLTLISKEASSMLTNFCNPSPYIHR